jgi:thioredoxin 1
MLYLDEFTRNERGDLLAVHSDAKYLITTSLGGTKMVSEPIHVTDAEFENKVLQSEIPVVVDFWAPWCGPCKMVAPTLDKLAKEQAGKVLIAKVNTDENPEWAGRYGVQGIPTMLLISGGKIVHRQVGALPEPMLRELVTQFMAVLSDQEQS